jgi:hypothetical protein
MLRCRAAVVKAPQETLVQDDVASVQMADWHQEMFAIIARDCNRQRKRRWNLVRRSKLSV